MPLDTQPAGQPAGLVLQVIHFAERVLLLAFGDLTSVPNGIHHPNGKSAQEALSGRGGLVPQFVSARLPRNHQGNELSWPQLSRHQAFGEVRFRTPTHTPYALRGQRTGPDKSSKPVPICTEIRRSMDHPCLTSCHRRLRRGTPHCLVRATSQLFCPAAHFLRKVPKRSAVSCGPSRRPPKKSLLMNGTRRSHRVQEVMGRRKQLSPRNAHWRPLAT